MATCRWESGLGVGCREGVLLQAVQRKEGCRRPGLLCATRAMVNCGVLCVPTSQEIPTALCVGVSVCAMCSCVSEMCVSRCLKGLLEGTKNIAGVPQ